MATEATPVSPPIRDADAGRIRWSRSGPVIMAITASVPFIPAAREFLARGIPDVLPTGDAAVLELGTLRALHGAQLLGTRASAGAIPVPRTSTWLPRSTPPPEGAGRR